MKRRLLIAKAMVHQPPILILDEPTAGVDVELRKNLWENVRELNKRGVTIILTTHYLFEAQEMCHRIAIIDKGNLVALDTTQKLLDRIQTKKVTFKLKKFDENIKLNVSGIKFIINGNTSISVVYEKNINKFGDILDYFKNNRLEILDITTEDSDLEDVFVKLTNN
jgi:ABC-2 type transport system ATP-binding protein